ncbi:MAG: 30S ribosomal protein S8 [Armatimonadota bacterium]
MYSDPIADMLTRIRNANAARHANVEIPASKLKLEVAKILHAEGFIRGFQLVGKGRTLRLRLRYTAEREPIIHGLKRISKPGQRIYAGKDAMPRVLGGLGIAIVSTSRGVMTSQSARKAGLGGEVLAYVW